MALATAVASVLRPRQGLSARKNQTMPAQAQGAVAQACNEEEDDEATWGWAPPGG